MDKRFYRLKVNIVYTVLHLFRVCFYFIYRVENCGMNFEWGLFQFTMTDCRNLVNALKATPTLHTLRLTSSKIGEEEGRILVKGLLEHPGLTVLG